MDEKKAHFLLVTFPAQGHLNPALQFAKRLLRAGANVTFATSISAFRRMGGKVNTPKGLTFATISDGYDDGFRPKDGDARTYMTKFRQHGTETLTQLFDKSAAQGNNITCLVYTLLLPWTAEVARGFQVPTALLWIQPATVFDIYYYYYNGYKDAISECENDPSWSLKLPNLPFEIKARDLPSFLLPSATLLYTFALPTFQEQLDELKKADNPTILINSFEALELESLRAIESLQLIPVGPLLLSERRDPSEKSFGVDLFNCPKDDYIKWLDSKEKSSVIYVSFGSISMLSKAQMEELGSALIQTHRPFLWVIREKEKHGEEVKVEVEVEEELSCIEELKNQGMIVPWCSQVEVLSHPSVGSFVTHCGWNSTLESLTYGVPMVSVPQWTDQTTNAKLVEEVWRCGVRVKVSQEEGLVKREEIKRCLEEVMENEEIKENAKKWKDLANEAAKEGGSSDINLKAFIKKLGC